MGFIDGASGQSVSRGYDYYVGGKVRMFSQIEPGKFRGCVSGSGNNVYSVEIDMAHPRKSLCDCPHAIGRRIICKHKAALFFAAFPEEAEKYRIEVIEYEEEQERRLQELDEKIGRYVNSLKKNELQELVFRLINEMTEWQFEAFVRDYIE